MTPHVLVLMVCVALFGGVAADSARILANTMPDKVTLWPYSSEDTLKHRTGENAIEIETSGDKGMLAVTEASVRVDSKARWHPALQKIAVSHIPKQEPTLPESNVWSVFATPALQLKLVRDSEGLHIRAHYSQSSEIRAIQESIEGILVDVLGQSYAATTCTSTPACENNTFHFNSTITFANSTCDLAKLSLHSSSPANFSGQEFCLVASRDGAAIEIPSLKWPAEREQWQVRGTHLELKRVAEDVELHAQEVLFTSRREVSVPHIQSTTIVTSVPVGDVDHIQNANGVDLGRRVHSVLVDHNISQASFTISGSGFHQMLQIKVHHPKGQKCRLLVEQPFPTTAYADMDELRRMERFGVYENVVSYAKHIEIERPSALSSQHVVAFVVDLSGDDATKVEIPVHFRYQFPSNSTLYRQIHLVAPSLYTDCGNEPIDLPQGLVLRTPEPHVPWRRVYLTNPLAPIVVPFPVGNLNDGFVVTTVTLLVSVIGCLLVLLSFPKLQSKATPSAKKEN